MNNSFNRMLKATVYLGLRVRFRLTVKFAHTTSLTRRIQDLICNVT